jgi:hypothetical protein
VDVLEVRIGSDTDAAEVAPALPKSLSFRKSIWQVLQLVPHMRQNAGIAWLVVGNRRTAICTRIKLSGMGATQLTSPLLLQLEVRAR